MRPTDVVIVGAGAAGLICAAEAGRRNRRAVVLDHSTSAGRKIAISGGGKCNFTNLGATPAHFVSNNPDFCRSALARFTPEDFVAKVRKHGIPFHEKGAGQLFCDRTARDIVNLLVTECEEANVDLLLGTEVRSIRKPAKFVVETSKETFESDSLVIATGGLSLPRIGATDFGYRIARQFGHAIVEPSPALDGFVFADEEQRLFRPLSGLSLPVAVTVNRKTFREPLLFTHAGLSGPAALQASLYWNPNDPVTVDFLPDPPTGGLAAWFLQKKGEGNRSELRNLLSQFLPKRFCEAFCDRHLEKQAPLRETPDKTIETFCRTLRAWRFTPAATVGYERAEVTRGGVDTRELSSKAMESRKIPGLFFVGEVVDVTGELGGFNFQWAWSSGWAAGQVV